MKPVEKVAIVTSGSGQELCQRLAKAGAKIAVNYRYFLDIETARITLTNYVK